MHNTMPIKTEDANNNELKNLRAAINSFQGLPQVFNSPRCCENSRSELILQTVGMILDTYNYNMASSVCGVKSEETKTDTKVIKSSDPASSKTCNDRKSPSQENLVKRPVSPMTSDPGNNIDYSSKIKRARLNPGHGSSNSSSKVAVEVVDISDDEDEGPLNTSKSREVDQVVKLEVGDIGQGNGIAPSSADGSLRNVNSEQELPLNLIPENLPSTSDTSVNDIENSAEIGEHRIPNTLNDPDYSDSEVNSNYDETSKERNETLGASCKGYERRFYAARMENDIVEGISEVEENSPKSDLMNSGDENSCVTSTTTCEQESVQSAASGNIGTINQALMESKVLQSIFKYLSFKDLKSCRKVTRLFNLEATKTIRKGRRSTHLRVTKFWVTLYKPPKYSKLIKQLSLQKFSEFVKNSAMFPCNYFDLAASLLKDPDVQRFFREHREIVEAVAFCKDNCKDKEYVRSTQNLVELFLGEQLPNLRYMSVSKSQKVKLFPEASTVQLKKLKILNLWESGEIDSGFLTQILKAAPNLEELCDGTCWFTNSDFQAFIQLNAMHLIKDLKIDFRKNNIELYEAIAQRKPSLRSFENLFFSKEIPQELWPRIGDVLSKLFLLSSQTLDCVVHWHPLGHITTLQLPVLQSMTDLRLYYKNDFLNLKLSDGAPVQMLPLGSNWAKIFPILHIVKISFDTGIFKSLTPVQVFPGENIPLLSVQELIVWYTRDDDDDDGEGAASGIPTIWIKHFCEMFPNLSVAYFEFVQDFASSGKYVWKLHNLKKLMLEIELNDKFNSNPFPSLDSTFTGFSRMKVKELYKQVPTNIQLSEDDVKALRGLNPSILDLHQLRDLTVSFIDLRSAHNLAHNEEKKRQSKLDKAGRKNLETSAKGVILSHITGRFGFQMCPDLNVEIKLRASKWYNKQLPFKSLQPYVPPISFSTRT